MTTHLLAAAEVHPGEHFTATIGGLTFNLDTIWSTAFAGLVLIGLGLYMRAKATSGVPSKLQLFWETLVSQVQEQVDANIGRTAWYVVPVAVTLFFFILIANWVEIIPSAEAFPSPTADVNMTYAMSFFVVIWAHVDGIRKRGFRPWARHFVQPYPFLFPINLIEEIMKPITLALRLFGNMFAGGIMIALITLAPLAIIPPSGAIWKLFDMFIGFIQAFIFALLTILYFGMALPAREGGQH